MDDKEMDHLATAMKWGRISELQDLAEWVNETEDKDGRISVVTLLAKLLRRIKGAQGEE